MLIKTYVGVGSQAMLAVKNALEHWTKDRPAIGKRNYQVNTTMTCTDRGDAFNRKEYVFTVTVTWCD
jgi:hypothetical protein